MTDHRRELTRADLPEEFTRETIRALPISVLRRVARPGNGILTPEEQVVFDAALHEVMSETAGRVSRQIDRSDWATVMRDANSPGRRGGPGRSARADENLRRLTQRFGRQVDVAEGLAPEVDWSFAQPVEVSPQPADPVPVETSGEDTETVSDLEQRLTDQVELVQVMSEIADMSKRTYALEQQRDLQNTRGVFFGFVVSVAVLVAGWAPIVATDDWAERLWILGLTVATCVVAGAVYALIRRWQDKPDAAESEEAGHVS
ncbi:MAG TPA: hypothetical protein VFI19_08280 [Nocardioides sp.]|nr:hypothetical protein [Nocardioides sp.]